MKSILSLAIVTLLLTGCSAMPPPPPKPAAPAAPASATRPQPKHKGGEQALRDSLGTTQAPPPARN